MTTSLAVARALSLLVAGALQLKTAGPPCWPVWFDRAALRAMLVAEPDPGPDVHVRVRVAECYVAPTWFEVIVTHDAGKTRRERVSVDGSPRPLRLRVLALIISEQAGRPFPPPPPPRLAWIAGATARAYLDTGPPLWGGYVGASVRTLPWLTTDLEIAVEVGSRDSSLGLVRHGLIGLRGAPLFALSERPALRVGPELELGWALALPSASRDRAVGRSLSAGLFSSGGRVALEWSAGDGWLVRIDAGGGMTWGGVRPSVEGTPAGGVAGPYLRAGVSLGHR